MTQDREAFQAQERLLDELLALDQAERARRLAALQRQRPELAAELQRWLDAIEQSPEFMPGAFAEAPPLNHGERDAGPWRPIRRIGRGGMGEVWLGQRADGAFERTVAIKYILNNSVRLREGLIGERKLLARLDHPGIARLLDGGVTDDGHPYLVAEFVDGIAIDAWCRMHRPVLAERLRLFREVCEAVAHAHQQLIVHRDIKPANVLVDGKGRARLLDFGIAQVVDLTGEAATLDGPTQLTPDFATPEDVRSGSYSTRSDVYALGALLYVLIADQVPSSPAVATGSAQSGSPVRPSTLAQPGLGASRRLLEDIDAIALKALRGEPNERYASVDLLLADIDNALAHRALSARPPSALDNARRYVVRNRAELAVMFVMAVCVVAFAFQTYRARAALQHAEQETQAANAVRDFLIHLFEDVSPIANRDYRGQSDSGEKPDLRRGTPDSIALLDRGEQRISRDLKGNPELQARLYEVLATINIQLGRYDRALAMALNARELLVAQGDEFSDLAIRLTSRAAEAAYARGGPDTEVRAMLDRSIAHLAAAGPRADNRLAYAKIYRAGLSSRDTNADQAVALLEEAIAFARERGGDGERPLALALHALGLTHEMALRPRAAVEPFREALALRERLLGRNHPETVATRVNLAYVTAETGSPAAAEPILRKAVESNRQVFSESHPLVAQTLNVLANVLSMQGKLDDAEATLLEALAIARRTTAVDSPQIDAVLGSLAMLNYRRGDLIKAGDYTRQTLVMRERRDGKGGDSTLVIKQNLAVLEYQTGHYAAAEQQLREVLDRRRKGGAQISGALMHLGTAIRLQGRPTEAKALHDEAVTTAVKDSGDNGAVALAARLARAATLRDLGELVAARADADAAASGFAAMSASHSQLPQARYLRAQLVALTGGCADAATDLEAALASRNPQPLPYLQWQLAEAAIWVKLCRRQQGVAVSLEPERSVLLASTIADPFGKRLAQRGTLPAPK